jgi:hypothetical protein
MQSSSTSAAWQASCYGIAVALSVAAGGIVQRFWWQQWHPPKVGEAVVLRLTAEGTLLWQGRPITAPSLRRRPARLLRLLPDAQVPWSAVLQRAQQLQEEGFALELQLPAT